MRLLLLSALTCGLALALWNLLGGEGEGGPEPTAQIAPVVEEEPDPDEETPASRRARLTTGTLVVSVRAPDGKVPRGAVAGYRYAGEDRVRQIDASGEVRFTDAPLGTLTVVARAPGYQEGLQQHPLQAGLRADVLVMLRPEVRTRTP